ncbi:MAG: hypothetical protein JST75_03205 [Bacteroidetes bacterium]|nr:hypothetical protein [Bacteroidota bacterium]
MARIFFIAIAFYLAYRLVFDLILPVYKTGKHMKQQFSNMHDQMHQNNQQQQTANTQANRPTSKSKVGEYIDFEETKEP